MGVAYNIGILAVVLMFSAGVSIAVAAFTFTGTSITGDSSSTIDATGTISIGALSATGITIGRSGITANIPSTVAITGSTTTVQNLIVSGSCVGCGGSGSNLANPYTNLHAGASYYTDPDSCLTVSSTITTDFQQSATSASVRLFTAPALWVPTRFSVQEANTVTSGAGTVTAVAASVGTLASPTAYVNPFPLMGASNPPFTWADGGYSAATSLTATQDVYLTLSVTNANPGNLSSLTGGVVIVRACGVLLQ